MRKLAIATACILLCGSAYAESTGEKLGVDKALGIAPTTQDFVTEAAKGGQFEIQSSKLAEQRGDAATQGFAKTMITDHSKIGAELKDLVKAKNIDVTIPDKPSQSQQSMIDKLDKLKGADFDKQYRDDQLSAHKDAVSLFQRYAKGGDNAVLKTWAAQEEPILQHHLDMARELEKQAQR